MPPAALASLVILLLVVALAVWIYDDARVRAEQGRPVIFQSGAFVLDTPGAWAIACLLLVVLFLPLYLVSRTS